MANGIYFISNPSFPSVAIRAEGYINQLCFYTWGSFAPKCGARLSRSYNRTGLISWRSYKWTGTVRDLFSNIPSPGNRFEISNILNTYYIHQ